MRYWKWMEYDPADAETGIMGDKFYILDAVAAEDEAEAYRILGERWPRQYFEGNELIEINKNEYDAVVADMEEDSEFDQNEPEMGMWELIATKRVTDSDGFMTDYTMYYNPVPNLYVMVFGDSELYQPEDGDWDFETESKQEAFDWFRNYNGFEDEDIESATDISRPDPEGDNLYGGRGQKTAWKLLDSKMINNINAPGKIRYSMWYQENEDWYVFIEGDPERKTPSRKSNWDFDTNDEDEAYEFWESVGKYRPYGDGDNIYGSDMTFAQKKYDLVKIRDELEKLRRRVVKLRDKYMGQDVQTGLQVIDDQLYTSIETWDKFFNI